MAEMTQKVASAQRSGVELGPRKVQGVVSSRPKRTASVQGYVPEVVKGIGITLGHFFTNTKEMVLGQRNDPVLEGIDDGINTISYPEQKRPYPERFRGVHRLTQRADGSPRCVACLCCSTACPAQCIHIEAADYGSDKSRAGYEKYPKRFVIDELRCIYCGMCEQACPVDAIELTTIYDITGLTREELIFDKEKLLSVFDQTKDSPKNPVRTRGGRLGVASELADAGPTASSTANQS